jgi:hypothetical protein
VRRLLLLPLAALLALVAAGCGSQALSKADYVAKADAICRTYDKKLEALPSPKSIKDIGTLADNAIPIVDEGIAKLRDLKPPDDLKSGVDHWLDLNKQNLDDFKKLRDAAKKGDASTTQALANQIGQHEKETDAAARKIGLKECGKSS